MKASFAGAEHPSFCSCAKRCETSIPPEELLGPSGPKLETELNMSSRGLPAPGPKKLKTESKKESKKLKRAEIYTFSLFFDSVLTFWTPGPEGPGNSFQLRFQLSARRAPELLWGIEGFHALSSPIWSCPPYSYLIDQGITISIFCMSLLRLRLRLKLGQAQLSVACALASRGGV